MKRISFTSDEIVRAFTEWDRRYRNDPDGFMSEVQHLLKETPDTYGHHAAIYFEKVLEDVMRLAPPPIGN